MRSVGGDVKVGFVLDARNAPGEHPAYSIVIPVLNEEATLPALVSRLGVLLARLDGTAEVVLVDDGSSDGSWAVIASVHQSDPRFKGIRLARNFGHQLAITAGMDLAAGDAVVIMDADLQDPPEVVLEMAERWREGYEVVYGIREDRSSDGWFKRSSARAFYRLSSRLSEIRIPEDVGDFRLVDRRAVDTFKAMREGNRYVRGMYAWVGFRQTGVPYRRDAREAGTSKYAMRAMMHLAADAVIGFSHRPLRLPLKAGALMSVVAVMAMVGAGGSQAAGLLRLPGLGWIAMLVCLLGGLQLGAIGIAGEYIGRTYDEVRQRPLYVVRQLNGLSVPIDIPTRTVVTEDRTVASILGESMLDLRAPSIRDEGA